MAGWRQSRSYSVGESNMQMRWYWFINSYRLPKEGNAGSFVCMEITGYKTHLRPRWNGMDGINSAGIITIINAAEGRGHRQQREPNICSRLRWCTARMRHYKSLRSSSSSQWFRFYHLQHSTFNIQHKKSEMIHNVPSSSSYVVNFNWFDGRWFEYDSNWMSIV